MSNEAQLVFGANPNHYKYAWIIMESALMSRPLPEWKITELVDFISICKMQALLIVTSDEVGKSCA